MAQSISDPNYEWATEDSQDIVSCIHLVIVFVFVFVEKVFSWRLSLSLSLLRM